MCLSIAFSRFLHTRVPGWIFLFGFCLYAAAAGAQPIPLNVGPWQFKTGDAAEWSDPRYDDSGWGQMSAGVNWQNALKTPYHGIAWYRKSVVIPAALQKEVEANGGLILHLGQIDDADETFFNGRKIGATGTFPPKQLSASNVPRVYTIASKDIRWDQPNLIAVRVCDWEGEAGLRSGTFSLETLSWKDKTSISIELGDSTAAFQPGSYPAFKIRIDNRSDQQIKGRLICELTDCSEVTLNTKGEPMMVAPQSSMTHTFVRQPLAAGFYRAVITLRDEKGYYLVAKCGFAVAPEQYQSIAHKPADFDAFWERTRAELATIPGDFKMQENKDLSTRKVTVYEVEMRSLGQVRIKGYYALPKNKTKLPAMLHLQGYSSVMQPDDLKNEDFAQFFLNIRGHGNSRQDVDPGFPGYLLSGIDKKETYIYRGAFMDCLRAVDFLCSRPEIDSNRIGVWGFSQGGALSIATAALDPRIKLCMPDAPFLSDFRKYVEIARWPVSEFEAYIQKSGKSWDQLYEVLDYFDIQYLAPMVHCPVLLGTGLMDEVCPPPIQFAMFNALGTPTRAYYLYPRAGHAVQEQQSGHRRDWMRSILGNP